jgi:hypothetical protein
MALCCESAVHMFFAMLELKVFNECNGLMEVMEVEGLDPFVSSDCGA